MRAFGKNRSDAAIAAMVATRQSGSVGADGPLETSLRLNPWIGDLSGAYLGNPQALLNDVVTSISRIGGIAALVGTIGLIGYLFI